MIEAIISLVVFALLAGIMYMIFRKGKPKINNQRQREILRHWKNATSQSDPQRRIVEADKVLDQILFSLGYQGSLGDKLKKAEAIVPNLNAVWEAHKLRNRIAHEPSFAPAPQESDRAMRAFEGVVKAFIPLSRQ